MKPVDWPRDLRPEVAHVHTVNTLEADLPPRALWPWLVRAGRWHEHYANCKRLRFLNHTGPDLRLGTRFSFWTFGVPVETEVTELFAERRLAWRGSGLGATGYHAWILEPTSQGTRIVTEETQRGLVPWLGRALLRRGLLTWHQRWLEGLVRKALEERTSAPPSKR